MKLSFMYLMIIGFGLSAITIWVMIDVIQLDGRYGYALEAYRLTDKPDKYFLLENPDSYVLESISNPQTLVFVNPDNTQIDGMIQTYGTNNIEYNGNYYEIQTLYADPPPSPALVPPLMLAWAVWGIAAIVGVGQ